MGPANRQNTVKTRLLDPTIPRKTTKYDQNDIARSYHTPQNDKIRSKRDCQILPYPAKRQNTVKTRLPDPTIPRKTTKYGKNKIARSYHTPQNDKIRSKQDYLILPYPAKRRNTIKTRLPDPT